VPLFETLWKKNYVTLHSASERSPFGRRRRRLPLMWWSIWSELRIRLSFVFAQLLPTALIFFADGSWRWSRGRWIEPNFKAPMDKVGLRCVVHVCGNQGA
jgi:hypothetical protein